MDLCRPTRDDQALTPQATEVEAVRWMSLSQYAALPLYNSSPLYKQMVHQCLAWASGQYKGFWSQVLVGHPLGRQDLMFCGHND